MAQEYRIKYLETPDIPKTPVGEEQGGGGSAENAVLYTPQSLTDSQKTQARTNVGAGTYSKPSSGIPASDLAQTVQASLGKADTALQTAPVTSVNGQTGAVTIKTPLYLTYDTTTNAVDKTPTEIDALSAAGYDVHLRLPMTLDQLTAVADMRYIAILNVAAFYGVVLFGSRPIIATATVDAQKRVNYLLSAVATQGDIPSLSGYATETWVDGKGYQTAAQVQSAIAAAAELPSGGTTGDFLRKTASGVAWETVPTYTGGSY